MTADTERKIEQYIDDQRAKEQRKGLEKMIKDLDTKAQDNRIYVKSSDVFKTPGNK